jgi:hypothetical protein
MMSVARRLASTLLRAVVRRSAADGERWGAAMLRELDFVESDWGALWWAVGGASALVRQNIGRRAVGVLSGVAVAAGVLIVCVVGLVRLIPILFPGWQGRPVAVAEWVTVVVIPEAVFVIGAVALWRTKRLMATGILLSAMTFITHVILHVATQ